jgi:hypothetical protein
MALPKIKPERLQKIVNEKEANRLPYKTIEELSYAVVSTNWAEENGLDAKTVAALIIEHKIVTKTLKPGEKPAAPPEPPPAPPPPAPVVKAPEPPPPMPKPKPEAAKPKLKPTAEPTPAPDPVAKAIEPPAAKVEEAKPQPAPEPKPAPLAKVRDPLEVQPEPPRKVQPNIYQFFALREAKARRAMQNYGGCNSVTCIPAGQPPVKLKLPVTRDSVEEWAEECRSDRRKKERRFLSLEALRYYISMTMQETGITDEQRKEAWKLLGDIYPDECD